MFWVYLTRYVPYVGNVEIHIPRILTYTTDRHFLSPGAAHYGPNNKDHMYLKLSLLLLIVTCMAESDFSSPQKKLKVDNNSLQQKCANYWHLAVICKDGRSVQGWPTGFKGVPWVSGEWVCGCKNTKYGIEIKRVAQQAVLLCGMYTMEFSKGHLLRNTLCFALLYSALLCFALLCFTLLYFALLYYALLYFALRCFAVFCFALLCFVLFCFALLCLGL